MVQLRLGAIDVGSNAIRLRIVERSNADDSVRHVTSARAPVRLGRDVLRSGRLSKATVEDATLPLTEFRAELHREGVTSYRAVATSAISEASNGAELVLRAKREADIELETIDGCEDARLATVAVARAVRLVGRTGLADVGGGSTEVTLLDGHRRLRSSSLPLGTVRLLEAWNPEGGAVGRRRFGILTEVVDRALAHVAPDLARAERIVVTGGTVTALAKLCGREGHSVSVARLATMLDRLRELNEEERAATFGLRADRADTILPAAVILTRVAAAAGAKTIEASGVGVRDGILAELAAEGTRQLPRVVAARLGARRSNLVVARTSHVGRQPRSYAAIMTKHEILWRRVRSRIDGDDANVDVFIAAVPGGHLVSTTGPGAPGLCFVPGKTRAVEKLIARADDTAKTPKQKEKKKPMAKKAPASGE